MRRRKRWADFDSEIAKWKNRDLAPAFIQEVVKGLWSVQVLIRRRYHPHGWLYRLLRDPPPTTIYEPYYNGWPGDHRGWMRFESKESARDFYKFATRLISFEDYCALPHMPHSDVRIDLDENGDFVELPSNEQLTQEPK